MKLKRVILFLKFQDDVTEPLDEFSFVSGQEICKNSDNQIIIKNKNSRDVSLMERLDAISINDDSFADDCGVNHDSYNQDYVEDFTNIVKCTC